MREPPLNSQAFLLPCPGRTFDVISVDVGATGLTIRVGRMMSCLERVTKSDFALSRIVTKFRGLERSRSPETLPPTLFQHFHRVPR